jgi:purine-binding chemotaxis protein CheW
MMGAASRVTERAQAMRREFDHAFAAPVQFDKTVKEPLLAIRAGGQPCAIRLSSISGLFADKKVTPVPGGHPALRGIAGFRGTILPVYDLPHLLGLSGAPSSRWLVVAKAAPIALAFDVFEAQLLVRPDAIVAQATQSELKNVARDFLRTPEFSGPILHLPSVLDAIGITRRDSAPGKE